MPSSPIVIVIGGRRSNIERRISGSNLTAQREARHDEHEIQPRPNGNWRSISMGRLVGVASSVT